MNYREFTRLACIYSGLKRRYARTFCNLDLFEPREGQEDALGAVQKFAGAYLEGEETTGLLLVGGVGSGKTYIVANLINYLVLELELYDWDIAREYSDSYANSLQIDFDWIRYNRRICFIVLPELYGYLRDCISENKHWAPKQLMNHLRQIDLLILDDMGAEKTSDWTKEILFNIIDYRYNEQLPLIVTTNCVPEELKEKIGDRNFDRLRESCALVSLVSESQRKTASLETKY